MAPTQKGKQATKGAKQIVEENRDTLKFYKNMGLSSVIIAAILNLILFEITKTLVIMSIITILTLIAAYQFMVFMSRPKYSPNGGLLDSGNDLNMEGGIAENIKDLIILASGTLLLTLLSNYFWFLLLLAPVRVIWMLWGSVIKPWLQQRNEAEDTEIDEKKQKKMERKMRRMR